MRLLIGGLDQSVADAAMLGAFADREHAGTAGRQVIVDDDAAIYGEAGAAASSVFGRMPTATTTISVGSRGPSLSSTASTRLRREWRLSAASSRTSMPLASRRRLEHRGSAGVELTLHQAVHEMHERDLYAGLGEP